MHSHILMWIQYKLVKITTFKGTHNIHKISKLVQYNTEWIHFSDVFSVHNNQIRINMEDRMLDLILQYSIVILICLIVVLLGAVMPFCGLFFCCCRCCGKCGARSRPYDKKHDLCRRIYLATMLIVCGTLLVWVWKENKRVWRNTLLSF